MKAGKGKGILLIGAVIAGCVAAHHAGRAQVQGDAAAGLTAYVRERSHRQYLAEHAGAARPRREIAIPAVGFSRSAGPARVQSGPPYGRPALETGETGYVEWRFTVPEAGLYHLAVEYYPMPGSFSTIEREVRINGARPFAEAKSVKFTRIWVNAGRPRSDWLGNQIRPRQIQAPAWREEILRDSLGYLQEPLSFYLKAGLNTVRLVAVAEPVALGGLRFFQAPAPPAYAEAAREYPARSGKTEGILLKIQGEDAVRKSDSMLSPLAEQGDPTSEPYHPTLLRLNGIGGFRWNQAGQWITWRFEVPEDGLYRIALKAKQDRTVGSFSNRRVLIDGRVPFAELKAVPFPYSETYRLRVLGPEDGAEPYLFYLTKGWHELTLEVVLGSLGEILSATEDSLYELNTIYRRIIMITSNTPDPLRSYELDQRIPGVMLKLAEQSEVLKGMAAEFSRLTGQYGGHTETLLSMARLLDRMAADPDNIPRWLAEYRDNIGALGTWMIDTKEQPLLIDYLVVASPDARLPRAEPTLWQTICHEIRAFLNSFTYRYDLIGEMRDPRELEEAPLKVWIHSGRDQFLSLKQMVEDSFTPETGIPVQLQLVSNMNTLLIQSTIAGTGPDVALGVAVADPMNYAFRGAAYDLASFPDFPEVAKCFKKSAFMPYRYRNSVYALPEQHSFPMLFYRRDILRELGLEVPETWDDIYRVLPVLQKENMSIGIGSGIYQTMLYQKGGTFYKEDGIQANLDSEVCVQTFAELTDLFNLYQLPITYNAENRFRDGVMPLVIADYGLFNRLSVFAPELRGEWGMAPVPGIRVADGRIVRTVAAIGAVDNASVGGPAVMILQKARNKEAAWEFLKWWTRSDTQARFGQELEALLGPAARYPTANVEAFKQLPWPSEAREKLLLQWDWVEGIPEVPGSYYANRMFDWAFRAVAVQYQPVRETLQDYNVKINEELAIKRREFGLETDPRKLEERWRRVYWEHYTHVKPPPQ